MTDGVRPLDAGARPRRLAPDTLGFACGLCFLLSSLSLLLHWYELKTPSAAAAARALGALTLFVAPLFPWLALASPEPVNGTKLVVFPAAVMLALTPWVSRNWLVNFEAGAAVTGILTFAIVGNAVAPLVPFGDRPNSLYKRVRWGAGGNLMLVVAVMALTAALGDYLWVRRGGPVAYRFATIALLVVFAFFLLTRSTTSPKAILLGLTAGTAVGTWGVLAGRGSGGPVLSGLALTFGALYCACHVSRTSSLVWTALGTALTVGAIDAHPGLAIGAVPALVILTAAALVRRNWSGVVLLVLLTIIGVAAVLSRVPFGGSGATATGSAWSIPEAPIALWVGAGLGTLGLVKLRVPPAALALYVAGLGFLVGAAAGPVARGDFVFMGAVSLSLLTGGLVAARGDIVGWKPVESAAFE
jgi:hypothetical protein